MRLVLVKERALRMFADHRQDYPSDTALAEAVAKKLGIGRETSRRWLIQADASHFAAFMQPDRFRDDLVNRVLPVTRPRSGDNAVEASPRRA